MTTSPQLSVLVNRQSGINKLPSQEMIANPMYQERHLLPLFAGSYKLYKHHTPPRRLSLKIKSAPSPTPDLLLQVVFGKRQTCALLARKSDTYTPAVFTGPCLAKDSRDKHTIWLSTAAALTGGGEERPGAAEKQKKEQPRRRDTLV